MKRKLFCEISPFTYRLSMEKEIMKRHVRDFFHHTRFANERSESALPVMVYRHNSLIRRRLGNVNMQLQENKAANLALAVTHIDGLLIYPGETFSVWKMVGRTTKRKGYKEGLTITKGQPSQGIGGGLCQLSNLIHWMVLHSDRSIIITTGWTSSLTLADRFPLAREPAYLTTISTTVSGTPRPSPISYAFGWMMSICVASCVPVNYSRTPTTSMRRMSISLVRMASFIATDRSIGMSLTALRDAVLNASLSAPTMHASCMNVLHPLLFRKSRKFFGCGIKKQEKFVISKFYAYLCSQSGRNPLWQKK